MVMARSYEARFQSRNNSQIFLFLFFNLKYKLCFSFSFFFFELIARYRGREKKGVTRLLRVIVANERTYVSYFEFSRNICTIFNSRDVNCEQGWFEKKFTRE